MSRPITESFKEKKFLKEDVLTDLFNVSGRVAIVTGGGRGIGFALAKGLASCGAVV